MAIAVCSVRIFLCLTVALQADARLTLRGKSVIGAGSQSEGAPSHAEVDKAHRELMDCTKGHIDDIVHPIWQATHQQGPFNGPCHKVENAAQANAAPAPAAAWAIATTPAARQTAAEVAAAGLKKPGRNAANHSQTANATNGTEFPVAAEAPDTTQAAVVTEPPFATEAQVATEAASATEAPIATEAAVATAAPVATAGQTGLSAKQAIPSAATRFQWQPLTPDHAGVERPEYMSADPKTPAQAAKQGAATNEAAAEKEMNKTEAKSKEDAAEESTTTDPKEPEAKQKKGPEIASSESNADQMVVLNTMNEAL